MSNSIFTIIFVIEAPLFFVVQTLVMIYTTNHICLLVYISKNNSSASEETYDLLGPSTKILFEMSGKMFFESYRERKSISFSKDACQNT